jgi:hypothetical protein
MSRAELVIVGAIVAALVCGGAALFYAVGVV